MFVRNKIVVCDGEGSGKYDPGKIDSLGDRHWTRWYGVTNVHVEDEKGNVVSCVFNEFMHKIRAYRFTFSSTLAHARIAIGGDFLLSYLKMQMQDGDFQMKMNAIHICSQIKKLENTSNKVIFLKVQ